MKYIDTSVIVSALDPKDTSSITSNKALKTRGNIISEIVTAELSSVFSKNKNVVKLIDEISEDRTYSWYAVILYIIQKLDLLFIALQQANIETPI